MLIFCRGVFDKAFDKEIELKEPDVRQEEAIALLAQKYESGDLDLSDVTEDMLEQLLKHKNIFDAFERVVQENDCFKRFLYRLDKPNRIKLLKEGGKQRRLF